MRYLPAGSRLRATTLGRSTTGLSMLIATELTRTCSPGMPGRLWRVRWPRLMHRWTRLRGRLIAAGLLSRWWLLRRRAR